MDKKIEVKDVFHDYQLYCDLIQLLMDIKIVQGNLALNSTLNRHPRVKKFLLENQVGSLKELENSIIM